MCTHYNNLRIFWFNIPGCGFDSSDNAILNELVLELPDGRLDTIMIRRL
jgi:hypothetical protein